jgi:salicylate biosynthesis isochorismate synthase
MDMLAQTAIAEQIEAQLSTHLTEALAALPPQDGDERVLSILLPLPRPPATLPKIPGPTFQFHRAELGERQVGYGEAIRWETAGTERLLELARAARRCDWRRWDAEETGFEPFAMIGFAATEQEPAPPPAAVQGPTRSGGAVDRVLECALPNALLWIPEVAIESRDHEAVLVCSTQLPANPGDILGRWRSILRPLLAGLYNVGEGPRPPATVKRVGSTPDRSEWTALVGSALSQIRAGEFEKVVLSRRLDVRGQRDFDVAQLLSALDCLFPSCQVLNLSRNGRALVAATPERLLRFGRRGLEVDALAGTALRAADTHEDAALRAALLGSPKNRHEHQVVIDAIRAALADCCEGIEAPDHPRVMQLTNAQHLWSRVTAQPHAGVDIFDLAARLHPTPATNGQPRASANAWRRANEPVARGWYTGAAGLWRSDGSGELWVLLRCALIDGARASLFAGAGIVAGSEPTSEWGETEAKLDAMLSALRHA